MLLKLAHFDIMSFQSYREEEEVYIQVRAGGCFEILHEIHSLTQVQCLLFSYLSFLLQIKFIAYQDYIILSFLRAVHTEFSDLRFKTIERLSFGKIKHGDCALTVSEVGFGKRFELFLSGCVPNVDAGKGVLYFECNHFQVDPHRI